MQRVIDNLRMFNRKERYYLVGMALGNQNFTLSSGFRESIGEELNLEIPDSAFSAMDYHLDWIYASLDLAFNGSDIIRSKSPELISGTQEDVDFIIAFQNAKACHIVILEAKGDMRWSNRQMLSKAKRLSAIFGEDGKKWDGVVPHFIMLSPRRPKSLIMSDWAQWMKCEGSHQISWMRLEMGRGLTKVTRCDKNGKPCLAGDYWTTERRHLSTLT